MKNKSKVLIIMMMMIASCKGVSVKHSSQKSSENEIIGCNFEDFDIKYQGLVKKICQKKNINLVKEEMSKNKILINEIKTKINCIPILQWSVNNGDKEVFNTLLELEVNPNLFDLEGRSAVHIASMQTDTSFLIEILNNGGNPNLISQDYFDPFFSSPLIFASTYGYLENIKILISNGADVNFLTDKNESAFSIALMLNRVEIAHYLLVIQKCHFNQDSILKGLRRWTLPINSSEHELKKEMIIYLKNEYNLDYENEPVPELFNSLYDKEYLSEY